MAAPEDWVGKRVGLQVEGASPGEIFGELLEVSDRGVVLSSANADSPPSTIFYPWRVVRIVQHDPGNPPPDPDDWEVNIGRA